MRKVVFLGATRGMGRELSRLFAERGDQLFLLGRQTVDLERSARDLEIRGAKGPVRAAICDLMDPDTFPIALRQADQSLKGFQTVVVTAGSFGTQEQLESDLNLTKRVLTTNITNTILFCEHVRRYLLNAGGGTLCVFSSVAGERGRKPVILYGAAKAGLSHYLEGLDHKYRTDGLQVVCVKPGFVKTGMTAGLPVPPFAGEPNRVARSVLAAIDRGKPEVYVPGKWRWIMFAIRQLPRYIMRRIEF